MQACGRARYQPGNRTHQCRLAGAVTPHYGHHPAFRQGRGAEALQYRARAERAVQVGQLERHPVRLRRASTAMKKGMPTSVVTIPTGISIWVLSCLAHTDAPDRMTAPVQALAGRYQR